MFTLYFSLAYLKQLSLKAQEGFSYFESNYDPNLKAFLDLILSNESMVKVDSTLQQIEEMSITNLFFKNLLKNKIDKIQFGVSINDYQNENTFLKITDKIPVFFSDLSTSESIKNEERFGHYFNNSESKLDRLFEISAFNFNPIDKVKDWGFSKEFLLPMNKIIIVDPYLYKKQTLISLEKLLKTIISKDYKGTYHISLIGREEIKDKYKPLFKDDLIKHYNSFKSIILESYPELTLSMDQLFLDIKNYEFHDRYILTNNSMIFLSNGLDIIRFDEIKKDSTWLGFTPFSRMSLNGLKGAYSNTLKNKKLAVLKEWVRGQSTNNPLLT